MQFSAKVKGKITAEVTENFSLKKEQNLVLSIKLLEVISFNLEWTSGLDKLGHYIKG